MIDTVFVKPDPDPANFDLFVTSWIKNGWKIQTLTGKVPSFEGLKTVAAKTGVSELMLADSSVINYGLTPGDVYSPHFTSYDPGRKIYLLSGTVDQFVNFYRLVKTWSDSKATTEQVAQRIGDSVLKVQPVAREYGSNGWSRAPVVWYSPESIAGSGLAPLARCVNFIRPLVPQKDRTMPLP
jgi:hypothetical protein